MKTGICIAGPAWIVRRRIATPAAHSVAVTLTSSARTTSPNRSTPPPSTCMPVASATTNSSTPTIARAHERRERVARRGCPSRLGAASSSRREKPDSKSAAIEKPVNTPPNADACSSTKTNWNAV